MLSGWLLRQSSAGAVYQNSTTSHKALHIADRSIAGSVDRGVQGRDDGSEGGSGPVVSDQTSVEFGQGRVTGIVDVESKTREAILKA